VSHWCLATLRFFIPGPSPIISNRCSLSRTWKTENHKRKQGLACARPWVQSPAPKKKAFPHSPIYLIITTHC
jgi:hypothetical protein